MNNKIINVIAVIIALISLIALLFLYQHSKELEGKNNDLERTVNYYKKEDVIDDKDKDEVKEQLQTAKKELVKVKKETNYKGYNDKSLKERKKENKKTSELIESKDYLKEKSITSLTSDKTPKVANKYKGIDSGELLLVSKDKVIQVNGDVVDIEQDGKLITDIVVDDSIQEPTQPSTDVPVDNTQPNLPLEPNVPIEPQPEIQPQPPIVDPTPQPPIDNGESSRPTIPEEPSTEEPSTEEPSTEEPSIEEPSTERPSVEEPSTEEPTIEEPSTEEPTIEEPTTEEPSEENENTQLNS
ncbi:hypothetical protein [Mammaliicoccus phage vB_MscM-PMS3]|nr:hypothetical protein [Mammaliicoccus phage vB_MscM-PMS3]